MTDVPGPASSASGDVSGAPAVFARMGGLTVLVWIALGVWSYRLALADDVRGVIVPVVQAAAALTAYGLRAEPTLRRWRTLLTVQAAALGLLAGLSLVSLATVWIAG